MDKIVHPGTTHRGHGAANLAAPQANPDTTTTVAAGQTLQFHGSLAAGSEIIGDGSSPTEHAAALIEVKTSATNAGRIFLEDAPSSGVYGGTGATLLVAGTLTNSGLIFVEGGRAGVPGVGGAFAGASLLDPGVLINSGTIDIRAAYGAFATDTAGTGAQLEITAVLDTSGLVEIYGGRGDYTGGATAGSAMVAGVLTNTGTILLDSGSVRYGPDAPGGSLTVLYGGSLDNAGQLTVAGGVEATYANYDTVIGPIGGGSVLDSGKLTNSGTLTLAEGVSGYYTAGQGASLLIDANAVLQNTGLLAVLGGSVGTFDRVASTGATLTDNGALDNAGSLLIGGAVNTTTRAGEPTAAMLIDNGVLTSTGAITVQASAAYYNAALARPPGATLSVAGVFNNQGQLTIGGSSAYRPAYGGLGGVVQVGGTLANTGTILALGGAGAQVAAFTGTGGTIDVTGLLTNAGVIELQGGAPWALKPGHGVDGPGAQLHDSGQLTNTGTLLLDSGVANGGGYGATITVTGLLTNLGAVQVGTPDNNTLRGFTYGGVAVLNVAASGSLDNSGVLTVNGIYSFDHPLGGNQLDVAGVLSNTGTIELGAGPQNGYSLQGAQLNLTGSLDNAGLLTIEGGNASFYEGGNGATLVDAGVLTNTGSLVVHGAGQASYYSNDPSAGVLIDSGTLDNAGAISLTGSYAYRDGLPKPGTLLQVTGVLNNTGSIYIGGGIYGFAAPGFGALLADAGVLNNAGTISIGGRYGSYPPSDFYGAGSLYDTKSLINTGLIDFGGGALAVGRTGTLVNSGTITGGGAGGVLSVAGKLINTGTINVTGPSFGYEGGTIVDSGRLANSGVITLAADPRSPSDVVLTITATGALTDRGSINGGGIIQNAGIISSGGRDITTGVIAVTTLYNDGSVRLAPGGAFLIDSTVTADAGQHGIFDLGAHTLLTLDQSVDASQQVAFQSVHATLAMGDAAGFTGILAGLQPTDTIDFLGLDVTAATTSGVTLGIQLANGTDLHFTLAEPIAATTTLSLASDGHGGTDLLFTRAPGDAAFSTSGHSFG